MHVHLHLNANDLFTQNYTELYIHHDGTDTYVADYYFDSDSAQGFSGNDFSNFDAGITTEGKLRLSYTNPLTVPVTVRANAVGFGATSNADGALRFKTAKTQADGDERSSFFSGNSVVGTGETTIFTASADTVNSVKSLVSVSYGSTYALHQILTLSPDSTNTYSTQYPFLSVGSTTGIGTFGAAIVGSNLELKFFPEPTVTGIVTVKSFNEVLYQELDQDSKEGLYENINYGSIKTQEYKIGLFDATNSSRINKTSVSYTHLTLPTT